MKCQNAMPARRVPAVVLHRSSLRTLKRVRRNRPQRRRRTSCPCEVLEEGFEGDIRRWVIAGMRQFDMYRLIGGRVQPLQLGGAGRQKVGKKQLPVSSPLDRLLSPLEVPLV